MDQGYLGFLLNYFFSIRCHHSYSSSDKETKLKKKDRAKSIRISAPVTLSIGLIMINVFAHNQYDLYAEHNHFSFSMSYFSSLPLLIRAQNIRVLRDNKIKK